MADITNQSLNEIIKKVKTKEISSLDLTKAYIKNIESAKKLNTFVTTTFDQALDKAKQFDNKPNFNPSPIGMIFFVTLLSSFICLLNSLMIEVNLSFFDLSATSPCHKTLSIIISPFLITTSMLSS